MEQLTPEQIQEQAIALEEAFTAGAISAEEFNAGMTDVQKKLSGYSAALSASLNQLGTAGKQLGQAMLKGDQGAAVYNEAMQSGANVAAVALEGAFGPVGMAVGILIKVVTYAIGQVNQMSDGLYKANQDLSKAGAAGAEGMSGIFDTMQKFGYGIKDLGDMGALISANSEALSKFGVTVEDGVSKLANMAKGIKNSDFQRQFMNLGMSVNDINKGIAGYVEMQTKYGIQSNESIAEQTQHAAEYIATQDRLTRMTGLSVDQLQAANAEADVLENWNAKLATMKPEQATQMRAAYAVMAKSSKTAALAMAADATGYVGFIKESKEMLQATGGASAQLTRDMVKAIEAGKDGAEAGAIAAQGMADSMQGTKDYVSATAMLGGNSGAGSMKDFNRMASQSGGKIIKALKDANATQEVAASMANEATNNHTEMLQKQMQTRDSLQATTKNGIGPVTTGMAYLAEVIKDIVHPYGGGKSRKNEEQEGGGGQSSPGANEQPPSGGGGGGKPELAGISAQGKSAQVGKPYASAFQRFLDSLTNSGYKINSLGGYADRDVRGIAGKKSVHALGGAIDINPAENPLGSTLVTDMPANISQMAAAAGLGWGGNWKSRKDAMHFSAAKSEGGTMISAKDGAVLSGSISGYKPNLTMHGTEAIVPLDKLEQMTSGKRGYSSTDITSAQSKVPIVSPFDDNDTEQAATDEPSMFDKLMLESIQRSLAATEYETRMLKRGENAVS